MTKRKSKNPKRRSFSEKRSAAVIKQAEELVEDGLFTEATLILREYAKRFPNDTDVLELWMSLTFEEENGLEMWDVARRLYKIDPTNLEYVIDMVMACMNVPMPFTALQLVETHADQLREHEQYGTDFDEYYAVLMAVRDQMLQLNEEGMTPTHLMQLEELQGLYQIDAFDEAQALALQLWENFPDSLRLRLVVADGNAFHADYSEAARLAQEALELDPNNDEARCNFIIHMFRDGKLDDIPDHVEALRAKTDFASGFEVTVALETWAWLGDDEMVVSLYEQYATELAIDTSPMTLHLAATSYAFLGDEKQAKQLWRKALKLDPNMDIASENLDDLKRPIGERHGPWHFQPPDWIPMVWLTAVMKTLGARNEKQSARQLQKFYDNTPAFRFILPYVFERSSEIVVGFAMQVAETLGLPILAEFALGQRGSDQLRLQAANFAAQKGLMSRGTQTELYVKGKRTPVLLMAYDIHSELDPRMPPRAIQSIIDDAYHLVQGERYDSALTLVTEGLTKVPDYPTLLNYLTTIYHAKGRKADEEAVIRRNFKVNPDYFFARCSMAELYVREGDIAAAETLLEPLLASERLHISEFGILCKTNVVLLTAKGLFDGAYSWLDMWEGVMPGLREINMIRRDVKIAERDARKAK